LEENVWQEQLLTGGILLAGDTDFVVRSYLGPIFQSKEVAQNYIENVSALGRVCGWVKYP
jgi:hypothetical protein